MDDHRSRGELLLESRDLAWLIGLLNSVWKVVKLDIDPVASFMYGGRSTFTKLMLSLRALFEN